ncbi:hypothetical protein [Nitrospira sp. Nam74]
MYFLTKVAEAEQAGQLRSAELREVVADLKRDQARRLQEIRRLVNVLTRLLTTDARYLGAVVGGDFNFEPNSPEYQELRQTGLRDTYTIPGQSVEEYSYDPGHNPLAAQEETGDLPRSLRHALRRLPESEQQQIITNYRKGLGQGRRIDYLFHMGKAPNSPYGCLRQELFGTPTAILAHPGSDHYGVLNTYILNAAPTISRGSEGTDSCPKSSSSRITRPEYHNGGDGAPSVHP